jgi:putative CocE/NonD family hydrolase
MEKTSIKNQGNLSFVPPRAPEAFDTYTVNYSTTTGKDSRWSTANWAHHYPNLRTNDTKAVTYTTQLLETPIQIIGHPVMHIWLRTDSPDLDIFAYLEEVDVHGDSKYVTEGNLRASHRVLSQPPYDNIGLPYHSYFDADRKLIPAGEPVELIFDLLPTAYRFSRGSRIRVTIACADNDNFETPVTTPAPILHLLRDKNHQSFVKLPVIQSR